MNNRSDGEEAVLKFGCFLRCEEKSDGTVLNYLRHTRDFLAYMDGGEITKQKTLEYKQHLTDLGYCASSVNAMIVSVNSFLSWRGLEDCRVKALRVQKRVFREKTQNLTKEEYFRLIGAARDKGWEELALIMETICSSGIRVSELKYITVEAVETGMVTIVLKGKVRTIIIPPRMCRKLKEYALKKKIPCGSIFVTEGGECISRKCVWNKMKSLSSAAQVEASKIYPHNLRHLFAVTYYGANNDLVGLADVLGHSNIETTRIYLAATAEESAARIERLDLIS